MILIENKVSLSSNNKRRRITAYEKYYYLMLVPGILYFIIFHYVPMGGLIIAFKDYSFAKGIFGSNWAQPDVLKWFKMVFNGSEFWKVVGNTLVISMLKLIFNFPAPIIFALLINEIKNVYFKKTIQTLVYLPHFISWVILGGMMMALLSSSGGITSLLGMETSILMNPKYFRGLLVVSDMWKEAGWGTIVYLAAITGINPELYESAIIDGAGRFQQMWSITLPSIANAIAVILILRTGNILNAGFDQVFILSSPVTMDVADIIDTYVYRVGLASGRFSLATVVGLFKSVVGLVLVSSTNWISRKIGGNSLW